VAELRPRISEIRAAGGRVVIVGSGAPMFLQAFREDMQLEEDVAVWSDEALASYKLAGLKRGVGTLLSPRAALNYARALKRGFRQKKTMGDATQQGGTLVVRPDGTIAYHFVSEVTGHHPNLDDVVAAFRKAA
jgi:AhpC/TSA antioxidant enzyme